MLRWIAVLSTLVLSGCVTTREVVYRDRYYPEQPSQTRYYEEGGSDRYYSRDGSYYSPSYAGSGDYYYGSDYYAPASYLDYPAYYSLFWSLNRSWYDPYYYPNYYYGVTYFPRNYLSVSFGGGYAWPRYSYWAYSPYRYSWADNYYDWSPWHGHYGGRNHYQRPRYGSARNEAERLSRISDSNRAYSRGDYGYGVRDRGISNDVRRTPYGTYGTARGNTRDADYGSRGSARQDPGTRGFGVPYDGDVRRNGSARGADYGRSNRELPATRGFGVPVDRDGAGSDVRRRDANFGAAREINRVGSDRRDGDDQGYVRPGATRRGYDEGMTLPRQNYQRGGSVRSRADYEVAPAAREYSRPQPAVRSYDRGGDGGYAAPPRERYSAPAQNYSAPAPSYSAPSRGYDAGARSAPAPSYSAPAPRYESRSEPARESRGESRSDSGGRGEVRRVGSRRDDD
jgi:hypothetical protein